MAAGGGLLSSSRDVAAVCAGPVPGVCRGIPGPRLPRCDGDLRGLVGDHVRAARLRPAHRQRGRHRLLPRARRDRPDPGLRDPPPDQLRSRRHAHAWRLHRVAVQRHGRGPVRGRGSRGDPANRSLRRLHRARDVASDAPPQGRHPAAGADDYRPRLRDPQRDPDDRRRRPEATRRQHHRDDRLHRPVDRPLPADRGDHRLHRPDGASH